MSKQGINCLFSRGYQLAWWTANRTDPFYPTVAAHPAAVGIGSWPDSFGDPWNSSLYRIDEAFRQIAALGLGYVRDWAEPRKWWGWNSNSSTPIPMSDSDGWEAVDRSVQLAHAYGMKIVLAILSPYTFDGTYMQSTWPGYTTACANYSIPQAQFIATRYSAYADTVIIDPMNEINGVMSGGATEWAKYQAAIYDAVKAVCPSMKVNLGSCGNWGGVNSAAALLTAMNTAGKISKFDDVSVHLYPGFTGSILSYSGNDGINGVTALISALSGYGRSDAKVNIDEFGSFWAPPSSKTQTDAATEITELMGWAESQAGVGRCLSWAFWGSSRATESTLFGLANNDYTGAFAQRGAGISDESTKGQTHYLTYTALANMGLTPKTGIVPPLPVTFNDQPVVCLPLTADVAGTQLRIYDTEGLKYFPLVDPDAPNASAIWCYDGVQIWALAKSAAATTPQRRAGFGFGFGF